MATASMSPPASAARPAPASPTSRRRTSFRWGCRWRSPPARTAGLGAAGPRLDPRGRLRLRLPLRITADAVPPEPRCRWPGHLRRQLQQDRVPRIAPRLRDRAARPARRDGRGPPGLDHPSAGAGPGRPRRPDGERHFRAAPAADASGVSPPLDALSAAAPGTDAACHAAAPDHGTACGRRPHRRRRRGGVPRGEGPRRRSHADSFYCFDRRRRPPTGLLLGFASVRPERFDAGMATLAAAIARHAGPAGGATPATNPTRDSCVTPSPAAARSAAIAFHVGLERLCSRIRCGCCRKAVLALSRDVTVERDAERRSRSGRRSPAPGRGRAAPQPRRAVAGDAWRRDGRVVARPRRPTRCGGAPSWSNIVGLGPGAFGQTQRRLLRAGPRRRQSRRPAGSR